MALLRSCVFVCGWVDGGEGVSGVERVAASGGYCDVVAGVFSGQWTEAAAASFMLHH